VPQAGTSARLGSHARAAATAIGGVRPVLLDVDQVYSFVSTFGSTRAEQVLQAIRGWVEFYGFDLLLDSQVPNKRSWWSHNTTDPPWRASTYYESSSKMTACHLQ
jgi:hypothetical protein